MPCTNGGSSRAVLFDLDGTLVDSFQGIADGYHHVLNELGLEDMEDAELKQLIGPPIQQALREHFGLSGPRLDEGVRIFREHYGTQGLLRFSKYDGIDDMLRSLSGAGYRLCISTSKLRTMAVEVVDHAGWTDLFAVVGGAERDGSRYLKKDVIEWTMTQLEGSPHVLAMVGDRAADIAGGRELGLPGIGVSWGYGSSGELDEAGATSIADSPDQLLPIVDRLNDSIST